jgi:hypothetical protein
VRNARWWEISGAGESHSGLAHGDQGGDHARCGTEAWRSGASRGGAVEQGAWPLGGGTVGEGSQNDEVEECVDGGAVGEESSSGRRGGGSQEGGDGTLV